MQVTPVWWFTGVEFLKTYWEFFATAIVLPIIAVVWRWITKPKERRDEGDPTD